MTITLALLRHGRADGQGPDARLLPEGAEYIAALGRHLANEGFLPAAAFSSPYLRARETCRILLSAVAPAMTFRLLTELAPEHDAGDTLSALAAEGPPAGRVLVVGHLPLLGLIAQRVTGDDPAFHRGTLVEIEMQDDFASGRLARVLHPGDVRGD